MLIIIRSHRALTSPRFTSPGLGNNNNNNIAYWIYTHTHTLWFAYGLSRRALYETINRFQSNYRFSSEWNLIYTDREGTSFNIIIIIVIHSFSYGTPAYCGARQYQSFTSRRPVVRARFGNQSSVRGPSRRLVVRLKNKNPPPRCHSTRTLLPAKYAGKILSNVFVIRLRKKITSVSNDPRAIGFAVIFFLDEFLRTSPRGSFLCARARVWQSMISYHGRL